MFERQDPREQIYSDYKDKVSRYISGKVQNPHDTEDLVSVVFLKVYQNLDSFDETKASMSTWIYRIAQNTVVDWYRKRRINAAPPEDMPSDENIEDDCIREEMLNELASALEKLDIRERDVIILRYYSGMKLKEIAQKMGLSYAMIKIIQKNALSKLRSNMSVGG